MKKIFALILAIAMLLTSVAAFAESVEAEPEKPKGTPNINTFATMKVKYVGAKFGNQNWNKDANYYEITLSKPVDRLLVKWAEKGAEPEELAVDENLQATAIAWGHKYMPGTSQSYATWVSVNHKEVVTDEKLVGYDLENSEAFYIWTIETSGKDLAFEYEFIGPVRELDPDAPISIEDQIASYKNDYPDLVYDIIPPVTLVDADGNPVDVIPGRIQGTVVRPGINPKSISTVSATPSQTAFMTVQGEWAVYYNRAGKIVGIELFEGQF